MKSNGLLFNQTAFLPEAEYEDEIDAVMEAAIAMVESILADKQRLGSPELRAVTPDDDE